MAIPRIFVSSTCYDLHDIRNNIRNFITNFGYDPVMSEFGDIFYDYSLHVQDACIKEISNCQMFLLIIGNNYGSTYYKHKGNEKNPSSITLMEFETALSMSIPAHIFVNRLVKYDYDNFRRFLDKEYMDYFKDHDVDEKDIDVVKKKIKDKFESGYHFPHDSYRHLFRFLDVINDLHMNNAIYTFETTIDIQEQLKKQWAGFVYEALAEKSDGRETQKSYSELAAKMDSISSLIQKLVKGKDDNGSLLIDINSLETGIDFVDLETHQDIFEQCVYELLYNPDCHHEDKRRGYFKEDITKEITHDWLNSLNDLLKNLIWSKTIPFSKVFNLISNSEFEEDRNIPYKVLADLNTMYRNATGEVKDAFIFSVLEKFKQLEQITDEDEVATASEDDDVPF